MESPIGEALATFEAALQNFRNDLRAYPQVSEALFEGTDDWSDLLTYKLVPHLAGEGCLVVAFAGGTNTGKSTVFNTFLGQTVSPVVNTAAATCRPIIAAGAKRHAECLASKLVPEFRAMALEKPTDPVDRNTPANALFVALVESLPENLVVMDTPDVDSIDKDNWAVAEHIRAAGDVLIAVVTAEKYKDDRIVQFFREAVESGRVILPLMNKADESGDFDVARQQLAEFRSDVGTDGPCFVVAHDPKLGDTLDAPIRGLDDELPLGAYLNSVDVPAIKQRVFSTTVRHFADRAGEFLNVTADLKESTRGVVRDIEAAAGDSAREYDPAPGAAVGGLFHEFVQTKRGPVRRAIGATSAAFVKTTSTLGRGLSKALRRRASLDSDTAESTSEHYRKHKENVEAIARDLASSYIERSRAVQEPLRTLLAESIETWDADAAAQAVVRQALQSEDISEAFREHAQRTLDAWWNDHKGKRRILESLDIVLAVVPAAIAAPIAMHTGGIGASEAAIAVGPVAAQFVTRVMELQFGDAMFDFLSPWKREQQEQLRDALLKHVTGPFLSRLDSLAHVLDGDTLAQLRKAQETCLNA